MTLNAKASQAAAHYIATLAAEFAPDVVTEFREQVMQLDADPADKSQELLDFIDGHDVANEPRTMESFLTELGKPQGGDGGDEPEGEGAESAPTDPKPDDAGKEGAPVAAKDDETKAPAGGDPASAKPGQEKAGASKIPGAPENPGDPTGPAKFKHGDRVVFQNGEIEGEGVIVASGNDGVIIQDDAKREHKVRHGRVIRKVSGGAKDGAAAKPAASAPSSGDVKKSILVFGADRSTDLADVAARSVLPPRAATPAVRKSDFGGDFGTAVVFGAMAGAASPNGSAPAPGANAGAGSTDPSQPHPEAPQAAAAPAAEAVETEQGIVKEREDGRAGYARSALRALQNFWNPGGR